jgi:hypothetical protein
MKEFMSMCSTIFESLFFASIWCHCAIFFTEQQSLIAVKEIESTTKATVLLRQNFERTKALQKPVKVLALYCRTLIIKNFKKRFCQLQGRDRVQSHLWRNITLKPITPLIFIYMLTYALYFFQNDRQRTEKQYTRYDSLTELRKTNFEKDST